MLSFEQAFFALAVKNRLLTPQQAQALAGQLGDGNNVALLKTFAQKTGMRMEDVAAIAGAARKYATGSSAAKPTGGGQEVIPGYKFVDKLGVGGTSTVFLAERANPPGKAAVKILHPKKAVDEKQRERFLREARLLTEFDHPNIVKGFAFGNLGNLFYFAMEYIDGKSVQDMIDKEGTIEEGDALEVLVDVARGLDYLHSKGYVHKDIKPGNIMISAEGKVKLCDLGFADALAKEGGDAAAAEEETEEVTVGTVQFMSPEQAQGQRDLDIRSDIYSLGATLYYMLMGKLPFQGESDMEVMAAHVMEELNSADIKIRRISQHMHYFIERMMSKDRELRYPSARAMIEDITQQIEGFRRIQSVRPSPAAPAAPSTRRSHLSDSRRLKKHREG